MAIGQSRRVPQAGDLDACRRGSVVAFERPEDQPPRGKAVDAPAFGGNQALVRAPANPIGDPLSQGVLVRWRPPTVVFEPVMRGSDSFSCAGLDGRLFAFLLSSVCVNVFGL